MFDSGIYRLRILLVGIFLAAGAILASAQTGDENAPPAPTQDEQPTAIHKEPNTSPLYSAKNLVIPGPTSLGSESKEAKTAGKQVEEIYGAREILKALEYKVSKSGPVDPYYVLGPRDKIVINLWGKKTSTFTPVVDQDGFVALHMDNGTARFSVSGIYFRDLKTKILRELAKITSDIDLSHPESSPIVVDVTLGEVRGINFMVLGEVNKPGQYQLIATAGSIFNAFALAGGITPQGSLRAITVRRPGGSTDKVDLYKFDFYQMVMSAKADEDVFHLRDGDIVVVPARRGVVHIAGEVRRPGNYEMKQGETLGSLVDLAQGLDPKADPSKIKILRVNTSDQSQLINLDFAKSGQFPLLDGDSVQIVAKAITRRLNAVEMTGDGVRQPGQYEYQTGMSLKELVTMSGGFYDDAELDKAILVRTRKDFSLEFSTLDIRKALDATASQTFALKPLDKIIVYSKYAREGGDKYVKMQGHVKGPGTYILSNRMSLYDLVFMAGGFADEDFLKETYATRGDLIRKMNGGEVNVPFNLAKLLAKDPSENHLLQSEDAVRIYSREEVEGHGIVRLTGHIKKPGAYQFRQGMKVSDLLFEGGGFEDPVFLKTIWLDRADLIRVDPLTRREKILAVDLRKVIEGDASANTLLQSPDELRVYAFADLHPAGTVAITGEVHRPGDYPVTENMTLPDLISLAKGLTRSADPDRIELVRFPHRGNFASQSAVVATVALQGDPSEKESVFLTGVDRVLVRRKAELRSRMTVSVLGQVAYPGEYVLLSRMETLSDVIARAGGLIHDAAPEAGRILRKDSLVPDTGLKNVLMNESKTSPEAKLNSMMGTGTGTLNALEPGKRVVTVDFPRAIKDKHGSYDITLLDGDEIQIPRKNWTVSVTGEVLFPHTIQYVKGASPSHYIGMAGGYTSRAYKRGTMIVYPNGEARNAHGLLFSSEVKPGSTIVVPDKYESARWGVASGQTSQPAYSDSELAIPVVRRSSASQEGAPNYEIDDLQSFGGAGAMQGLPRPGMAETYSTEPSTRTAVSNDNAPPTAEPKSLDNMREPASDNPKLPEPILPEPQTAPSPDVSIPRQGEAMPASEADGNSQSGGTVRESKSEKETAPNQEFQPVPQSKPPPSGSSPNTHKSAPAPTE